MWPFRVLHNCTAQPYQDPCGQKDAVCHWRHQRAQKGQVVRRSHESGAVTDRFDDGKSALESTRISWGVRDLQAYPCPETGIVELENRPIASSAQHPSEVRQRPLRVRET